MSDSNEAFGSGVVAAVIFLGLLICVSALSCDIAEVDMCKRVVRELRIAQQTDAINVLSQTCASK